MGTDGILQWFHSLDASLRASSTFVRTLSMALLMECPKSQPHHPLPKPEELQALYLNIAAKSEPRLQVACIHGMHRYLAIQLPNVANRTGAFVVLCFLFCREVPVILFLKATWSF
jgi:hypothetical protein